MDFLKSAMDIHVFLKAVGFLSLEAIGIPGNVIVLACFAHLRVFTGKFMPSDTILCKLSFVNLVVVLIQGLPQLFSTFGWQRIFNQQGCNFVIFTYRVCRAMSICMSALLSCFQGVLLTPPSNVWATIKKKLVQYLFPIMISIWCLNIIIYFFTIFSFSWGLYPNSTAHVLNINFCLIFVPSYAEFLMNACAILVRDLICVGLMSLSSVYIVIVLYRHKQRLKSIRISKQDGRSRAETNAAKAVVMLVSTYVFFFGLDNAIWLYSVSVSSNVSLFLTEARIFFGSCYSALCPVMILATNKKLPIKLMWLSIKKSLQSPETRISHK